MRFDQCRRELTLADGRREWPHELRVEQILENGISLHKKPVERLGEPRELRYAADRREADDVEPQRTKEGRCIRLRVRRIAAP